MEMLLSKLKSSLYCVMRVKPYLNKESLLTLFHSLILSHITGWSNFCTLVGHFSKLFEFAGLSRLKTPIFVPKSGCSLKKKKKRSSIGIDLQNSYFRPKIIAFFKKKSCRCL